VVNRFIQRVDEQNPGTLIGKGKLEEIRLYAEENEVDMIIFDDDLSPTQLRNIEEAVGRRVLDRH
jgi:GTP-binding protein HflX